MKKTDLKKNWIQKHPVIFVFIVLVVIGLVIGGKSSSTPPDNTSVAPTSNPTTPTITLVPSQAQTSNTQVDPQQERSDYEAKTTTVTVANLYKDPNSYKGTKVNFNCKITSFLKDSSGNVSGVNCLDSNDPASYVQIEGIAIIADVTSQGYRPSALNHHANVLDIDAWLIAELGQHVLLKLHFCFFVA